MGRCQPKGIYSYMEFLLAAKYRGRQSRRPAGKARRDRRRPGPLSPERRLLITGGARQQGRTMESTEQGSHLKQGDHGAMNYGTVSAHHGGQAAKPKHASGGGWGRFARLVALAVFFIVGALGVSSVLTSPRSSSAKQHAGAVAPRVHAHAALAAGAGAHGGAAQGVEGGDKVE